MDPLRRFERDSLERSELATTLRPDQQAFFPVKSHQPVRADHPDLSSQIPVQAPIAIPRTSLRQLTEPLAQGLIRGLIAGVSTSTSMEPQKPASSPLGDRSRHPGLVPRAPASDSFPRTSWRIYLSRLRSAISCLSRRFSPSSSLSLLSSLADSPPSYLRHQ